MPNKHKNKSSNSLPIRVLRSNSNQVNIATEMASSTSTNNHIDLTGYGSLSQRNKLHFSGNPNDYKQWQTRAKFHLRKLNLLSVLDEQRPDIEKNSDLFTVLVNLIDDKSLKLIQDVAFDDGQKAWTILNNHYLGDTEQRTFKVLTEFSNLQCQKNRV